MRPITRNSLLIAAILASLLLIVVLLIWLLPSKSQPGAKPTHEPAAALPPEKPFTPIRPEFARETDPSGITRVYFSDFSSRPGTEWSDVPLSKTPKGNRPYLGGFVREPLDFQITNLPPHKLVRLSFHLYLIRSWDGSSKTWGEKIWDLSVTGQQNLIHTTFSNCGFFSDNNEQAFPDSFPCKPHPAWTGASEKQTLGVMQSWGSKDRTFDTSSVYHLVLTFPHTEDELTLEFLATMRKYHDKSWGLGSFKIETLPDFSPLSPEELTTHFNARASSDAVAAFHALWKLASANPTLTLPYIKQHLADPIPASSKDFTTWAQQLASEDSQIASHAYNQLLFHGQNSAQAIQAALKDPNLVSQHRARLSRAQYFISQYPETADELRSHRIKRLLEIINTPESLSLAKSITPHPPS